MDLSADRNEIQFSGNGVGYMGGENGTLLKTTDNGSSWTNVATPIPSNYSIDYIATFEDGQHIKIVANRYIQNGFVQYGALIISSNDGGVSWRQLLSYNNANANGYFGSDQSGWIALFNTYEAIKKWKTTDGGLSWQEDPGLPNATSIRFLDAFHGWALVRKDGMTSLFKTNDGGINWSHFSNLNEQMPNATGFGLHVINKDLAFISTNNSTGETTQDLYKTTDGGITWLLVAYPPKIAGSGYNYTIINHLEFVDEQIGWMVINEGKYVFRTTDGANSWQLSISTEDAYNQIFKKTAFHNERQGNLIGTNGFYATTQDGGQSWKIENYSMAGTNHGINDLYIRESDAWILSRDFVLRAAKGESSWHKVDVINQPNTYGIDFSGTKGVLVGDGYRVSDDNGADWENTTPSIEYSPGFSWQDMKVYMRDQNTIWLSGVNSNIFKSTNGGQHFASVYQIPSYSIGATYKLAFQTDSIVWAYDEKESRNALKSNDSGKSWQATTEKIVALHFLNEAIGWKYLSNKNIYWTMDGGANWQLMASLSFIPSASIPRLSFVDEFGGWISTKSGKIYHTQDGGRTWTDNGSGVPYTLNSLKFHASSDGTVAGLAGGTKILKYAGNYRAQPLYSLEAPANIRVTDYSRTFVSLQWQDQSGNEDGFYIQRQDANGNFQTIATLPANTSTFTDNTVSTAPSALLVYRVGAYKTGRITSFSNKASIKLPPLQAPENLQASLVTEDRISLSWQHSGTDHTGFKIEYSTNGTTFYVGASVTKDVRSYSFSDLSPSRTYHYRIKAYSSNNESGYTDVLLATTLPQTPPAAPSGLTVTPVSQASLQLSWTDNATNESGFSIERSLDGISFSEITTHYASATSTVNYTDSNLQPDTRYYYRVSAYRTESHSEYTEIASSSTLPIPPPLAPSSLRAGAVGQDSIQLLWQDNATDETGFRIELSLTGADFTAIDSVIQNIEKYTVTALNAGTTYFFRVQAFHTNSASEYSQVISSTTLAPDPPAVPSGLRLESIEETSMVLSWSDNSSDEDGFIIERSQSEGTFEVVFTTSKDVTSYRDTGLYPNTHYHYRIKAFIGDAYSTYSPIASAFTLATPPPTSPGNPVATAVSVSSIQLDWQDLSSDEAGFLVEQSIDGATFSLLTTLGANTVTYTVNDLQANTTYFYRIQAFNSHGQSNYTEIVSATTYQHPPMAPSQLQVVADAVSGLHLSWIDNADDETGYILEKRTNQQAFTTVATLAANTQDYHDQEVENNVLYTYRLKAIRDSYSSDFVTAEGMAEVILGLDEVLAAGILIYPNPVQMGFTIDVQNLSLPIKSIVLLDAIGTKLREIRVNRIDTNGILQVSMDDLPAGLYLIKIEVEGAQTVKRIIKH